MHSEGYQGVKTNCECDQDLHCTIKRYCRYSHPDVWEVRRVEEQQQGIRHWEDGHDKDVRLSLQGPLPKFPLPSRLGNEANHNYFCTEAACLQIIIDFKQS